MLRILFVTHACYLDNSNGAAIASRSMMESLNRLGFTVKALSGTVLGTPGYTDPDTWLKNKFDNCITSQVNTIYSDMGGISESLTKHYAVVYNGTPVVMHRSSSSRDREPDQVEVKGFVDLLKSVIDDFKPDVMINYGGNEISHEIRKCAKEKNIYIIFPIHNFNYRVNLPFVYADKIIVPSKFAAKFYRQSLGLHCDVLPNYINVARIKSNNNPEYLTFVNPSYEKGVYVFAKIAEKLGRTRPDIPILVVEGRGTEETLANCGIDLREYGNVNVMSHTTDPRNFWGVTKLCLMPSLWWENQPLVAIESMINGIPVIATDRGGIPETLGKSGIMLTVPSRLTAYTRELPTDKEVEPWIKAIISIWDDSNTYERHKRLALKESVRWDENKIDSMYLNLFSKIMSSL